jgi:hypothetical protein
MIRFFKEVYFTGFAIIFKMSRTKRIGYKAGNAICAITVIELLILIGILGVVEMLLNKPKLFYFSRPVVITTILALYFANMYVLCIRRYGIKFAHEFDSLKQSRKTLLAISCAVLTMAAIVFFICSFVAHRHFIGAN